MLLMVIIVVVVVIPAVIEGRSAVSTMLAAAFADLNVLVAVALPTQLAVREPGAYGT